MKNRTAITTLALILLLFSRGAASAGDWSQWRGPDRDAHASGFDPPRAWPEELTRVWTVEAGAGLSSPVVTDGRAYLLTREGEDEIVTCYDVTNGAVLWRQSYPSRFYANGGAIHPRFYPESLGRGPFATPVVRGKRIYTLGVNRVLSSFATKHGRLKWRHAYLPVEVPEHVSYICPPCGCKHDGQQFDKPGVCPSCGMGLNPENLETTAQSSGGNYYGAASSPLIAGDLGIAQVGNMTDSLLVAYDRENGRERWRHEGPTVAYASPVVAALHGTEQVIALTRTSVVGLDLASGAQLWSHGLENNAHASSPLVLDDLVIASTYQGPTFALTVGHLDGAWSVEKAWENTELTQWMASPVLDGDRLNGFFFSKKGQFATLDARTGKTIWAGEGRQGESAALVVAGNRLVGLKNDGTLVVLRRAGEGYETERNYKVADSPTWAYPALIDDKILVKDESRLTLWSVR